MRVVEKIIGTAGCGALTGAVSDDGRRGYVALAHAYPLTQGTADRVHRESGL